MAQPVDLPDAILQLAGLIDADLYTRIDATNRAKIIGWGLFFVIADQVRAVQTLHRVAHARPQHRTVRARQHRVNHKRDRQRGERRPH